MREIENDTKRREGDGRRVDKATKFRRKVVSHRKKKKKDKNNKKTSKNWRNVN